MQEGNEQDDETRDWVRQVFSTAERTPQDVVPTPGLTREALERQSAAAGKPCSGTIPGKVICDPDGIPIGVEEARTVTGIFGGTVITEAEAERLGIAPGELPGITIIPTTKKDDTK
ncbi:hypothetical protein [Mycolicibacterium monacense]|uniref:Uncharacterized protein n=1 Tax=Mycolicibacterium monacense TaxID=85693 RepID=A0AAD1J1A5_MYCMB|nr:hypothetical protein [Mycolicibacterium monacense]MDA4103517.1 hypothetical protein [Mycolicibacterium monacense DSM 44395]ORB12712.1 hypothetical protein BST34_26315 [Mycolicibacterium monacense DSM 44395]QHP83884.1 hypothetical protein EWR22_00090 [Mycolicibacterium monacense DSM 44395]BBZ63422.1 hypothetical protein MMON_47230 [Mycolicibacterium monacense]